MEVYHLTPPLQHIIREIMKRELLLTFKKLLSRSNNVDFDWIKVLRFILS